MNAATTKAWIVAASIGAVEALKDQGICRWNYPMRSVQQHFKNNIRSFASAKTISSSSSSSGSGSEYSSSMASEIRNGDLKKKKKQEASMEKVMGLSCLGPSTIRF
ncbi:hypothetical protein JCGZ_00711 [Jatropha curcas]|uniref:Wound-responsive family protein n=1 Tax=Jatropha curcas TaxID=180498 RepID=A0A067L4C8_JATCU|nr:uncharacterized protein LOC105632824 [Jatropha curcas]KDP38954.1 hypothetical protein JCGZ_00711 [Jatropha curcas]